MRRQPISVERHDDAFFETRHQVDQLAPRTVAGPYRGAGVAPREQGFAAIEPQAVRLKLGAVAAQTTVLEQRPDIFREVHLYIGSGRQRPLLSQAGQRNEENQQRRQPQSAIVFGLFHLLVLTGRQVSF